MNHIKTNQTLKFYSLSPFPLPFISRQKTYRERENGGAPRSCRPGDLRGTSAASGGARMCNSVSRPAGNCGKRWRPAACARLARPVGVRGRGALAQAAVRRPVRGSASLCGGAALRAHARLGLAGPLWWRGPTPTPDPALAASGRSNGPTSGLR
ncbi:hypothetical protein SORBI_3001G318100 [Sorghum bicolor]|uniref:Uncharacterized protein n=1 Tax=Sorghum bicolor TaxID=4558 RepID=A0A1B6QM81_SORBI|nr:hypothetical protein SORBI_3001G318100 [Sorghum bicolor]